MVIMAESTCLNYIFVIILGITSISVISLWDILEKTDNGGVWRDTWTSWTVKHKEQTLLRYKNIHTDIYNSFSLKKIHFHTEQYSSSETENKCGKISAPILLLKTRLLTVVMDES